MFRKKHQLRQEDISYIMDLADFSHISRWEQGIRSPNIGALLMYEMLFDVPISSLFARQKNEIRDGLSKRIQARIEQLKAIEPGISVRISFLTRALAKLVA